MQQHHGGEVLNGQLDTTFDNARVAAKVLHENIMHHSSRLGGHAATSLGPALRCNRYLFDGHTARDLSLDKVRGYIAAAADAERHLTTALVQDAVVVVPADAVLSGS